MSDAGTTKPWTELHETKPRKPLKASAPPREKKPHHWRNLILGWAALAVVLAGATYAVNAWVNRSLVVVPATLGGMPQTTDPSVQDFVETVRGQQHAEPGAPSTQYTVTGYGTESDYAVSVIVPAGHAYSEKDIDQLPQYNPDLEFGAPTTIAGARCISGREVGRTTVWCMRTDDTASAWTIAGSRATVGRTAAMTGEAFDAQH